MIRNMHFRRSLGIFMIAALLLVTLAPGTAFAGIVGTGEVIAEEASMMDRDNLLVQLDRDDVRAQLERMGVSADKTAERVAAMSDAEVRELTAGLANQPAGAGAVLIVVIVILIVLLR